MPYGKQKQMNKQTKPSAYSLFPDPALDQQNLKMKCEKKMFNLIEPMFWFPFSFLFSLNRIFKVPTMCLVLWLNILGKID